jgi:hypothetical protein
MKLVEGFADLLVAVAMFLGIAVTFGVLKSINASTVLWSIYIVELVLLVVAGVLKGLTESEKKL